ncbi:endo-1,6-alpha-mannosidase [Agrocybe pediades]|nr:endo-1,6-alpha-mannosidase [Agrocybe pediades]
MYLSLLLLLQFTVLALSGVAVGQNLTVDANWRKPTTSLSQTSRISIAQNAINALVPQLDSATGEFNGIGYWQSGNAYSAMALLDQVTHSTTNKAVVVGNLKKVFGLRKNFDKFGFNDDAMWWATAAYYAYRAYGDTTLLADAVATWNAVTPYVMTASQAQSGKSPVKNFALTGSCDGFTMAGGVFWRPTTDDKSINSITTGLYVTLSAYLAEVTGDAKYTNAAILSANWIKNHNINSGHIVLDSESGADCSRSSASWIFTYNSGKFIEGLAILYDHTKDPQWNQLMLDIVAAAVKNKSWQGTNGIITEGGSTSKNDDGVGFKAVFIRGLLQAYRKRAGDNASLAKLLRSYIDVQYNALLDLASAGNDYSAKWVGPAPASFNSWGQLAALDVLVAAVGVN